MDTIQTGWKFELTAEHLILKVKNSGPLDCGTENYFAMFTFTVLCRYLCKSQWLAKSHFC